MQATAGTGEGRGATIVNGALDLPQPPALAPAGPDHLARPQAGAGNAASVGAVAAAAAAEAVAAVAAPGRDRGLGRTDADAEQAGREAGNGAGGAGGSGAGGWALMATWRDMRPVESRTFKPGSAVRMTLPMFIYRQLSNMPFGPCDLLPSELVVRLTIKIGQVVHDVGNASLVLSRRAGLLPTRLTRQWACLVVMGYSVAARDAAAAAGQNAPPSLVLHMWDPAAGDKQSESNAEVLQAPPLPAGCQSTKSGTTLRNFLLWLSKKRAKHLLRTEPADGAQLRLSFVAAEGASGAAVDALPPDPVTVKLQQFPLNGSRPSYRLLGHKVPASAYEALRTTGVFMQLSAPGEVPPHWQVEVVPGAAVGYGAVGYGAHSAADADVYGDQAAQHGAGDMGGQDGEEGAAGQPVRLPAAAAHASDQQQLAARGGGAAAQVNAGEWACGRGFVAMPLHGGIEHVCMVAGLGWWMFCRLHEHGSAPGVRLARRGLSWFWVWAPSVAMLYL